MKVDANFLQQLGIAPWQRQGLSEKLKQTLAQIEQTPRESLEISPQATPSQIHPGLAVVWLVTQQPQGADQAWLNHLAQMLSWTQAEFIFLDEHNQWLENLLARPSLVVILSGTLAEDQIQELQENFPLIQASSPQQIQADPEAKRLFYQAWLNLYSIHEE